MSERVVVSERSVGSSPVVIVADRDRGAGQALAVALTESGLPAVAVTRAAAVLTLAHWHWPRLVVVDAALRDLSGLTLVQILREMMPEVAVVLTSCRACPVLEHRARELGVVHYAPKPVLPAHLAAIAERAHAQPPRARPGWLFDWSTMTVPPLAAVGGAAGGLRRPRARARAR